jgi:hypothetical protein
VPVEVASPKLLDANKAVLVRHLPFNRPVVLVERFGDRANGGADPRSGDRLPVDFALHLHSSIEPTIP